MQTAAKVVGFTVAGGGVIFLVAALLTGMIILSLIPIYTTDISSDGFGEIYAVPGFTIKAVFTNVTFNFTGGSVISVAALSTICTRILRQRQIPGFYACLATNFSAYGPTPNLDPNSVIQRRALDDVALYEIGDIRLLFTSTCSNQRALGIWSTNLFRGQNSSCYAQRTAFFRSFITTPNIGNLGNRWSPLPGGYTQLVVSNITGSGCSTISISNIYNVAFFNYGSVYSRFNVTRSFANAGDCYLESIVPQQTLFNLVNNQFFTNGSICTSTTG